MKKSLIALAVAGTFAAPAFAATSNVDVYGKLHMAVSVFDDQPTAANDVQVSSQASRFGIKGAEDLGGGLSAIWQVESALNLDEQNGTLANRNSFIGLKGGFGTFLAGNHDTPLKLVGRTVDLFGDTYADSRNVLAGGSDTRAKNVLVYMTPDMGGFGVAAAYSTDLATGTVPAYDRDNSGVYNLSASLKNGPIYVGLGYGDGDGHEALGLGAHWRLGAGLTMGNFKLVAQYDSLEDDNALSGLAGDFAGWMVGGAFTMGNVVLKANYMEGEYDGDLGTPGYDVEQFTIGVDYNLSKRTGVYALYAAGENVAFGARSASSDPMSSGVAGGDLSVLSFGMTHSF